MVSRSIFTNFSRPFAFFTDSVNFSVVNIFLFQMRISRIFPVFHARNLENSEFTIIFTSIFCLSWTLVGLFCSP